MLHADAVRELLIPALSFWHGRTWIFWSILEECVVQRLACQNTFWGCCTGSGSGLMSTTFQSVVSWKMAMIGPNFIWGHFIVFAAYQMIFWSLITDSRSVLLSMISKVWSHWGPKVLTLGQSHLGTLSRVCHTRRYLGLLCWFWISLNEHCCPECGFPEDSYFGLNVLTLYQSYRGSQYKAWHTRRYFRAGIVVLDQAYEALQSRVWHTRSCLFGGSGGGLIL